MVEKVQRGRGVQAVLVMLAAMVAMAAACAPRSAPPSSTAQPVAPEAAEAPLSDGPGRQILNEACTSCHALTEVTKFRGFYGRPQWRDIVLTMVDYGAPVNEKQVEVLTDYLTKELGKR